MNTGKHAWEGKYGDSDGLTRGGTDAAEVVEALVMPRVSN